MPASDAGLLQQWKNGDTRSGEQLFARYYDAVSRFFGNKVTRDRADLVQATFSACLEKVDGLKSAASFRSFLFGIARFELLHYYRRKSRREVEFDAENVSVYDVDPTPSRVIAKHQEQRLLLEALRHIPLELQIVLELTYWEKLTSAEMADLLGIAIALQPRSRRGLSFGWSGRRVEPKTEPPHVLCGGPAVWGRGQHWTGGTAPPAALATGAMTVVMANRASRMVDIVCFAFVSRRSFVATPGEPRTAPFGSRKPRELFHLLAVRLTSPEDCPDAHCGRPPMRLGGPEPATRLHPRRPRCRTGSVPRSTSRPAARVPPVVRAPAAWGSSSAHFVRAADLQT